MKEYSLGSYDELNLYNVIYILIKKNLCLGEYTS